MIILNLMHFASIASSAIQGAKKGLQKKLGIANILACSYLYALGGNIVFDIFILQTYPKAFSINNCLPEIAILFMFGLLYFKMDKYRKYLEIFSAVSDTSGLLQLVYIGASKAQNNSIVAVLSAIIITFFGESIKEMILSNSTCRITTIGGAIVYVMLTECGVIDTKADVILVFYTLLLTLSDPNFRAIKKQYFIKLSKSIQHNELFNIHLSCNPIFPQMYICNEHFFCKLLTYSLSKPMHSYTPRRYVVILLHRIRRM